MTLINKQRIRTLSVPLHRQIPETKGAMKKNTTEINVEMVRMVGF